MTISRVAVFLAHLHHTTRRARATPHLNRGACAVSQPLTRFGSTGPAKSLGSAAPCGRWLLYARSFTTPAALLIGGPLAPGILALIHPAPDIDEGVKRYVKHPVENVEVIGFCIALGALLAKLCGALSERAACRAAPLPPWDGRPVPIGEAVPLRASLRGLGRRLQNTYLVRRITGILDFVTSRGSASDLDDQMRTLADNDAVNLEGSYSLVRFLTWAIPILGFLGTVLGITEAISGMPPEMMEKNINRVTDGLSQAFDATALALALTLVLMLISSLVERLEQGVLGEVDHYVDA